MFLFSCCDSGNKKIIKSNGGIELGSACSIKDLVKDMVNDRRTTIRVIADKLGVLCSAWGIN